MAYKAATEPYKYLVLIMYLLNKKLKLAYYNSVSYC